MSASRLFLPPHLIVIVFLSQPAAVLSQEESDVGHAPSAQQPANETTDNPYAALEILERVVRQSFSPRPTSSQIRRTILDGDYDAGIALLAAGIDRNPKDAGKTYDPSPINEITSEDLDHGRKQLLQMFKDRPVMLNHTDEHGPLGKWATRQFAGESTGFRINWDATLPTSGSVAQCSRQAIRVAKVLPYWDRDLTFEELWSFAIFELHNIRNRPGFDALHKRAKSGAIDRDDYIMETFRLEHRAIQTTRAFYCRVYLPWAKENKLRTDPDLWGVSHWGGADEWLRLYPYPDSDYPWIRYGMHYDRLRGASSESPTDRGPARGIGNALKRGIEQTFHSGH